MEISVRIKSLLPLSNGIIVCITSVIHFNLPHIFSIGMTLLLVPNGVFFALFFLIASAFYQLAGLCLLVKPLILALSTAVVRASVASMQAIAAILYWAAACDPQQVG